MNRSRVAARIRAGELVTTSQACERLGPDITPARLRDWLRRPDVAVDVVRDPSGRPVRVPGSVGRGSQNVWEWRQLVDAEAAVALSPRGRPRGRPAA